MIESSRDAAIARGIDHLVAFIGQEKYFRIYLYDYLYEFANIAQTATDERLRSRAAALVCEWLERAREMRIALGSSSNLYDCKSLGLALLASDALGLKAIEPLERITRFARRLTADAPVVAKAPKVTDPDALRKCTSDLTTAYVGLRLRVPLGLGYGEALAHALALRPYPALGEIGMEAFLRLVNVATHVVYTASQYNALRLDPALVAAERELMRGAVPALMDAGKCEMTAECLDALGTCGLPYDDPLLAGARGWLISRQRVNGSWDDPDATETYKRYHVTLAAVQGLRPYRLLGDGPLRPWVAEFLRTGPRADPAGWRSRVAPPDERSRADWPPPQGFLLQRALASRPAVFAGAAQRCPAWSRWTDEFFRDRVGEVEVVVEVSDDVVFAHPERKLERKRMTIRQYLDGPCRDGRLHYLAQVELSGGLSPLCDDVPLEGALPPGVRCRKYLWFAEGERVTPLHYDASANLYVVFRGRKRIMLYPPRQSALLYRANAPGKERFSRVDAEAPDLERFPLFARAEPRVIDLEAGQALFIPEGWWHHVRSWDSSLAVSLFWWPVRETTSARLGE